VTSTEENFAKVKEREMEFIMTVVWTRRILENGSMISDMGRVHYAVRTKVTSTKDNGSAAKKAAKGRKFLQLESIMVHG
jgi:hypothetical protein